MDPITALSVASSIITFVDFGGKLLSDTRKLYKSANGILSSMIDIETLAFDLTTITQGLKRQLPQQRLLFSSNSHREKSEDDEVLDNLCERCVQIGEELKQRLDRLNVYPKDSKQRLKPTNPPQQ